jgi:hypothetical protein
MELTDAEQVCVDIFNDFDESELKGSCPSIIKAWEIGRDLS